MVLLYRVLQRCPPKEPVSLADDSTNPENFRSSGGWQFRNGLSAQGPLEDFPRSGSRKRPLGKAKVAGNRKSSEPRLEKVPQLGFAQRTRRVDGGPHFLAQAEVRHAVDADLRDVGMLFAELLLVDPRGLLRGSALILGQSARPISIARCAKELITHLMVGVS